MAVTKKSLTDKKSATKPATTKSVKGSPKSTKAVTALRATSALKATSALRVGNFV